MPVTVLSPFSGRPVKVRDQDVGRAVKDQEGRIFYVIKKSDGSGYYGAPTRAGGPKDEARALELENKTILASGNTHEQVDAVHDATGKGRRGVRSGTLLVIIFLILAAALFIFSKTEMAKKLWQPNPAPPANIGEPARSGEAAKP